MLVNILDFAHILRDPKDTSRKLDIVVEDGRIQLIGVVDGHENDSFLIASQQPVLIDFSSSLLDKDHYSKAKKTYSHVGKRHSFPRKLKGLLFGTEVVSRNNFKQFLGIVKNATDSPPLILMVGAGGMGVGAEILYEDNSVHQVGFDIYPSNLTNIVADAHKLPFASSSFDAVCIQAVLEHVLEPKIVVDEINRVLKPGGYVYAETPFMQQVHEGAYDFTRFTELGHRWLWRDFVEVRRGAIGGPGVTFFWAVRYLFWGLTRNRKLASILSLPFGIFAVLDRFIPEPLRVDGASGCYFMGQKTSFPVSYDEITSLYMGKQ